MEIPGKGGSIKKINEKYIYSLLSGKSFKDENFPVASFMINRKLKEFIRHFYFFARTSDDIADHEKLRPKEKLKILSYFDKCLKEKKKTDISVLNKLIITLVCCTKIHTNAQDKNIGSPTLMEILVLFNDADGNNCGRNVLYIEILTLIGARDTF